MEVKIAAEQKMICQNIEKLPLFTKNSRAHDRQEKSRRIIRHRRGRHGYIKPNTGIERKMGRKRATE